MMMMMMMMMVVVVIGSCRNLIDYMTSLVVVYTRKECIQCFCNLFSYVLLFSPRCPGAICYAIMISWHNWDVLNWLTHNNGWFSSDKLITLALFLRCCNNCCFVFRCCCPRENGIPQHFVFHLLFCRCCLFQYRFFIDNVDVKKHSLLVGTVLCQEFIQSQPCLESGDGSGTFHCNWRHRVPDSWEWVSAMSGYHWIHADCF